MVATATRPIVATSEEGGCPCSQSRQYAPVFLLYRFCINSQSATISITFMLSLEVVGQGGSVSTLLMPCLICRMPVGEGLGRRQWRYTGATARHRRSSLGWGKNGGGNCSVVFFIRTAKDIKLWVFIFIFVSYLSFSV
jgi:hypothetical protein